MKLIAFSVQNYRSITKTKKLPVSNSTVLIGPNNEGKSNILRALVLTLSALKRVGDFQLVRASLPSTIMRREYSWEKDFPISLQKKQPDGESVFSLELELNEPEVAEFKSQVGSRLNGTLPVQISIGREVARFSIRKKGPGAQTLSKKVAKIARFVSGKLDFVYIPAVRTAESAKEVVEELMADELAQVEQNEEFRKALAEISGMQQPVLDRISSSIKATLKDFLPNVRDVRVTISERDRFRTLRRACEITIDDGTPTPLQYKGDGVQSLAALSLMRYSSELGARGRHLILAIEEPESHLHPSAIHQLRKVLVDISRKCQVVMTTHCPGFIDRVNIGTNILVESNRAIPAKNVTEIREVLGVKASDNLQHAELVLVVEGEDDRTALLALLAYSSAKLRSALENGTLAIDPLHGGAKLSYKLTLLRDSLCNFCCLLDADECGRNAYVKAETDGLLTQADVWFTECAGMAEAEMEDMYDQNVYAQMLNRRYGVSVSHRAFRSNRKWSDRMGATFREQAKSWTDEVKQEVKNQVARAVGANPGEALSQHKRSAFDFLVTGLETKLDTLPSPMRTRAIRPGSPHRLRD